MNSHHDSTARPALEATRLELLPRWLIQHAARNSPAALSERLEEEWLAHLAAQRGTLSRLCFAIGCCWAMRVIARDYLASGAPAGSSATGQGAIILGPHDAAYFSCRTTIFLLIVFLHALVIYGFATGFTQRVIEAIPGRLHVLLLEPPSPRIVPPPLIGRPLVRPKQVTPTLIRNFDLPPDPITERPTPESPPPSVQPAAAPRVVTRVLGRPAADFPNSDDYYPIASRRLGEMGVASVQVCVDDKGRLASAPTIAHSSGSARLDNAALRLAKAGTGHYLSTTVNGAPVPDCYPFDIRFQLKE
jgi:TonB family protein